MKVKFKEKCLMNMQENAKKAESMLKILANQKRLMILCYLSDDKKSAGELAKLVGLSHSALSQHLLKMKQLDLVEDCKQGKEVFYAIKSYEVRAILTTLYLIYCR
jgi:DNA-binding transcriptional ArsR family regulator